MTVLARRSILGSLSLSVALLAAAACGSGSASPSPSVDASIAVATTTPSVAVTPSIAPSPSATPTPTATPTTTPTAKPTSKPTSKPTAKPTACPAPVGVGPLPSDRIVDLEVSTTGDADLLTFVFGKNSIDNFGGTPQGEVSVAKKPFTAAGSGLPIDVEGAHVLQVVFRHMSIVADTGDPVYGGPPDVTPELAALQQAVMFDESEGQLGWYIGYDGTGCVTLSRSGDDLTFTFEHAG